MGGYLKRDWETFPVHKLTRVDRPTTVINEGKIQRVRERQAGFCKASAGDYGPKLQREFRRFVPKHPVSGALAWMRNNMRPFVDGMVAAHQAPVPNDPAVLARHIKETAYFLRADAAGVCELPQYAVYSHKFDFMNPDAGEVPVELNHKYAIAVLIDQDYRTSHATSGSDWISNAMSMLSYSTSGFVAIILAEYIRRLALPNTSGDSVIQPRHTMHHSTILWYPRFSCCQD